MTQENQNKQLKPQVRESEPQVNKPEPKIVDQVLTRINDLVETGAFSLPKDYNAAHALQAAWMELQTVVTSKATGYKPVLTYCTKTSIANALYEMVVQGLTVLKKQCYFIPRGNILTLTRSYFGDIALARRAGMVGIPMANIVYADDVFEYGIDNLTGASYLIRHQTDIKNINSDKIIAAYAIIQTSGGGYIMEVMTLDQIKKAWDQGEMKGNSPAHKNFPDQMCKRTIINRACKVLINSSNDAYLDNSLDCAYNRDNDLIENAEILLNSEIESENITTLELPPIQTEHAKISNTPTRMDTMPIKDIEGIKTQNKSQGKEIAEMPDVFNS